MDAGTIAEMIKKKIPGADVNVEDVRGDGRYFSATVIAGCFDGLTRIQQHRQVHSALEGIIGNDLHALQIVTKTAL
jgi:acid stress-induced BolA-like protein IbaG/YrbA